MKLWGQGQGQYLLYYCRRWQISRSVVCLIWPAVTHEGHGERGPPTSAVCRAHRSCSAEGAALPWETGRRSELSCLAWLREVRLERCSAM